MGLVLEAQAPITVISESFGKHFDGNKPIESRVFRLIDFAHTTRAKEGKNLVGSKLRTWSERHECRDYSPNDPAM